MTEKILWVLGSGDNTMRKKYIFKTMERIDPNASRNIEFIEVNKMFKFWVPKPKTKATFMLTANFKQGVAENLNLALARAKVVVINDFSLLAALLHDRGGHGSKKKLATYRGGKYIDPMLGNKPAIVLDDVSKAYVPPFKNPSARMDELPAVSDQLNVFDMEKVCRHYYDKNVVVPAFDDRYTLLSIYEWDQMYHHGTHVFGEGYSEFRSWLARQSMITIDFETTMNYLSCAGVTGIENYDLNTIHTYTIPFIDSEWFDNTNMRMRPQDFIDIIKSLGVAQGCKIYANGAAYDVQYHLKYNAPVIEPVMDVMHMWHSYRPRIAKSLATISSVLDDDYYYWKDEIKGGATEKKTQTKYALPVTRQGWKTYWRYCGLDCHSTMVSMIKLLHITADKPWVLDNYVREMSLQLGPLLKMNYMGTRLDAKRLKDLLSGKSGASAVALEELKIASNGLIQTGTNEECATWLYDVLLANMPKVKGKPTRSMDQKQLNLVKEQNIFLKKAVEMIRAVREPGTMNNLYKNMKYENNRFNYTYSIMGTWSGRYGGGSSAMWLGTNPQNVPKEMRQFVVADKRKILIDIDYSQADLYHFAVAVGDENMIRNVFDDRDTHAVHVEMILKVPYDDVMRMKNSDNKAEWAFVNDSIKGVRQIIKRLSHGGNYGMTPSTAYLNAGRESLEAAADYIGYDHGRWTYSRFLDFTEELLVPYFETYAGQLQFRQDVVKQCVDNKGLMECPGGLKVYFHEWQDHKKHSKLMRDLLAFMGQGGTAGMINQAMLNMYYKPYSIQREELLGTFAEPLVREHKSFLEHYNIDMMLQGHDSLTYQVDIDTLVQKDIVNKILLNMEVNCIFNGREYKVPCEADIGPRWAKGMVSVERTDTPQVLLTKAMQSFENDGLI